MKNEEGIKRFRKALIIGVTAGFMLDKLALKFSLGILLALLIVDNTKPQIPKGRYGAFFVGLFVGEFVGVAIGEVLLSLFEN